MPIICRLLRLSPEHAAALANAPEELAEVLESADVYTDVYRYWHAIQYLLERHAPSSAAASWLDAGRVLPSGSGGIPDARVLFPEELLSLDEVLQVIEPDALAKYYEAAALDAAGVYPKTWESWEETFDPLGQVLEHYSYLQYFVRRRAEAGEAMLLHFSFADDGSDD